MVFPHSQPQSCGGQSGLKLHYRVARFRPTLDLTYPRPNNNTPPSCAATEAGAGQESGQGMS
jgi:hypothetical protein